MGIFSLQREGFLLLTLVFTVIALYAVIAWPRVKGKGWLVAFLTLVLLARLHDLLILSVSNLPSLWMSAYGWGIARPLLAVAYLFLVVGLFQLRSSLVPAKTFLPADERQDAMPPH